jgi:TPR repeat protein
MGKRKRGADGADAAAVMPLGAVDEADAGAGCQDDSRDVECCICCEVMDQPTVLPACSHSACLICVRTHLVLRQRSGLPPLCPLCRAAVRVPPHQLTVSAALTARINAAVPRCEDRRLREPLSAHDVTPTTLAAYRAKAATGDAAGQALLGACYFSGWRVGRDAAEARRLFQLAAKQGFSAGIGRLGILLCDQPGASAAQQAAGLALVRQAAEAGHGRSMNNLGWAYASGSYGAHQDAARAVEWYSRAAELGDPMGAFNLGRCFAIGADAGAPAADARRAAYWYQLAAAAGEARAMSELAELLHAGVGVAQDEPRALALARAAAGKGEPEALYRLGRWHATGACGLAEDMSAAVRLWRRGARMGQPWCKYALARAALLGAGDTRVSQARALRLLREAAAGGGDADAAQVLAAAAAAAATGVATSPPGASRQLETVKAALATRGW